MNVFSDIVTCRFTGLPGAPEGARPEESPHTTHNEGEHVHHGGAGLLLH